MIGCLIDENNAFPAFILYHTWGIIAMRIMLSTNRIAVFHYHLLPGGVTTVIFLSLKALIHHHPSLSEILLVTGTSENAGNIADKLRREVLATGRDIRIGVSIVPEIGYTNPNDAESLDIKTLKERLCSDYGGYFWWIHNYHLGKNPIFTAALIEAAEENPSQRMLFHIHDFPEDGRYHNLSFLRSFAGSNVYPVLSNVRYAVINSRDYQLLLTAGMPKEVLFFLNNPVERWDLPPGNPDKVRECLKNTFAAGFPAYNPEKPLWLYPVRTIRRKNALEAGLICLVAETNLVLTLPGVSKQEKPYSDLVESLYIKGLLPGMWGIGRNLDEAGLDFTMLASSADAIISSSVQEGFGYLYTDTVQWGRPLIARDLEILDGIRDIFTGHPAVFYAGLDVPLDPQDIRVVKERYARHTAGADMDNTGAKFLEKLAKGTADFAALPVEVQVKSIERAQSLEYRTALRELNAPLFTGIEGLSKVESTTEAGVFTPFEIEAFSRVFGTVLDSYHLTQRKASGSGSIQEALVDLFTSSNVRHLLYEYQGM